MPYQRADLAKCENFGCPARTDCLRYTMPASEYQTWADFDWSEETGCTSYINNDFSTADRESNKAFRGSANI